MTQSDLPLPAPDFSPFGTPAEVPNEVRKVRAEVSGLPGSLTGKRKSGSTGLSFPSNAGKSGGLPFPRQGTKAGNLRDQIQRLENDMLTARQHVVVAMAASDPLRSDFQEAHARLEALQAYRRQGRTISKAMMIKAYDDRMNAGHRWNPSKTELKEAELWLKRIQTELKAANAEMGS